MCQAGVYSSPARTRSGHCSRQWVKSCRLHRANQGASRPLYPCKRSDSTSSWHIRSRFCVSCRSQARVGFRDAHVRPLWHGEASGCSVCRQSCRVSSLSIIESFNTATRRTQRNHRPGKLHPPPTGATSENVYVHKMEKEYIHETHNFTRNSLAQRTNEVFKTA